LLLQVLNIGKLIKIFTYIRAILYFYNCFRQYWVKLYRFSKFQLLKSTNKCWYYR